MNVDFHVNLTELRVNKPKNRATLAMFLPLLLFCFFSSASATEFDFGTLTLTSLSLLGDAHLRNNTVYLTRDLLVPSSGSGRALYTRPVQFRTPGIDSPASFSTFFSFSVSNPDPSSIGGGLAFLLAPDIDSIGGAGGLLGLQSIGSAAPANKFVAVEFDTSMDVEYNDVNGNHVGLDLNEVISTDSADLGSIEVDLRSGDLINAWIEFNGPSRSFNVSVSYSNIKPTQPIVSLNIPLEQYVNDFMFVGFSGSTQGSTESHSIEWWSFSSSFERNPPPPTSTLIIPAADSAHPSHVPVARPEQWKGSSKQGRGVGVIAGVVTAGVLCFTVFTGVLLWIYTRRFSKKPESSFASDVIKTPKEFSYKELKSATKGFDPSRIVGQGAFGTVYKGVLQETGELVAVKRWCSQSKQGKTEFLSELCIIGTLRHRNLVRLQGWCHEKGEILLVYDFMPNGSLDKAIFESRSVLQWPNRKKILRGVASALAYLHQECENRVVHRDVKSSNIMLDEGYNARLGDFGLARQVEHGKSPEATVAAGTMGYLAPEYLLTGRASEKTDVFSFGAVVLEVASGWRPIEKGRRSGNLVDLVWGLHREGRVLDAADERLAGEFDGEEMRRVLLVGLACSNPDPVARPTMRGVVQMLVGEAESPFVPREVPKLSLSTSQLLLNLQDDASVSTTSSSMEQYLMGEDLV